MQKGAFFFKSGIPVALLALALVFTLLVTACPTGGSDTTFVVSFSPGEGSGTAPANQKVETGTIITLPNQGGMTAPNNKTFAGWKASGQDYTAGSQFTVTADTVFTASWNSSTENPDNPDNPNVDDPFVDFHNYPTGRTDQSGMLTVKTGVANRSTLLFMDTVAPANYLGTLGGLGEVKLKLPDQKFYTIVAVDKQSYEERKEQATPFSVLTYYSNTQTYSVTVSPASTYGTGIWRISNKTSYWVSLRKTDGTETYAVIKPGDELVNIPVVPNTPYPFFVYFSKEVRYNGQVIAVIETTDKSQANTAQVDNPSSPYTTVITEVTGSANLKPAVLVKNNSAKSVQVFYANQQKTNGSPGADMVITGGRSQLVTGFEINDNTNVIEFSALAWDKNLKVPVSMVMVADKVYEITIPKNENASEITVTEVEGSSYYN